MAVVFHLGSGGSDETGSHGWLAAYSYFRLSALWKSVSTRCLSMPGLAAPCITNPCTVRRLTISRCRCSRATARNLCVRWPIRRRPARLPNAIPRTATAIIKVRRRNFGTRIDRSPVGFVGSYLRDARFAKILGSARKGRSRRDSRAGLLTRMGYRMPVRIQRKRTKGWRMPENTVCVTRGTRWGNPFEAEFFGLAISIQLLHNTLRGVWNPSNMKGHDTACNRAYEAHHAFLKRIGGHPLDSVFELRGKNLACWCEKGKPCHADLLLSAANPVHPYE